jgi:hypothetical protein
MRNLLIAVSVLTASALAHADTCDPAKVGAQNAMNVRIDGKAQEIRSSLVALSSQNTEVAKQLVSALTQALKDIESNRARAVGGAGDEAFLQCKEKHEPLQNAIDIGVVAATGGLAVLLPARAWNIDAGEIAKGKILGGKCSFARNPLGHGC